MPLKEDHIREAISHLEAIVANNCQGLLDVVESQIDEQVDLCEYSLESFMDMDFRKDWEITQDQPHRGIKQCLDITNILQRQTTSVAKSKEYARKAVDFLYESLGEIRPATDPNQIEINFEK